MSSTNDLLPPIFVSANSTSPTKATTTSINVDQNITINPIELLNSRSMDFHQGELPELYSKLTTQDAKKEFSDFWKLVQSIKANPDAHKYLDSKRLKRLITTRPLKLSEVFKEIKKESKEFNFSDFLKSQNITLNMALLDGAQLNGAELNRAHLYRAQLNGAQLNGAELNRAHLYRAQLNGAEFNERTFFDDSTELLKINVQDGIYINGKLVKNQDQIKAFFIRQGAKDQNISFAQAA
jgi:hypothetical protein